MSHHRPPKQDMSGKLDHVKQRWPEGKPIINNRGGWIAWKGIFRSGYHRTNFMTIIIIRYEGTVRQMRIGRMGWDGMGWEGSWQRE